jgi:hypothetical protein
LIHGNGGANGETIFLVEAQLVGSIKTFDIHQEFVMPVTVSHSDENVSAAQQRPGFAHVGG